MQKGYVSFSDNVLASFVVMVAKLELPKLLKEMPSNKIGKLSLPLHPVQLSGK